MFEKEAEEYAQDMAKYYESAHGSIPSHLNDDIKLFVEKSKGYEDEHLPKDVIAWKEIVLLKESE